MAKKIFLVVFLCLMITACSLTPESVSAATVNSDITIETTPTPTVTQTISSPTSIPAYDPLLILIVDNEHPITQEYIDTQITPNLVDFTDYWTEETYTPIIARKIMVNKICLDDLVLLIKDAKKAGITLNILSGFRDYVAQQIVLDKVHGDTTLVAKPGYSQHHTGLAIDFTSPDVNDELGSNFADTDEFLWLSENAWQYGFVQSYTSVHDGIQPEPWHFYYLGRDLTKQYLELKEEGKVKDLFDFQNLLQPAQP
jgi:D-alanyl-D-alanine carboxypeptidase